MPVTRLPDAVLEAARQTDGCGITEDYSIRHTSATYWVDACDDCLDRLLTCPAVVDHLIRERVVKLGDMIIERIASCASDACHGGGTLPADPTAAYAYVWRAHLITALTSDPRSPDDA